MKNWQKIGLLTAAVLAIFAIRIYFIYRERHEPMVQQPKVAERKLTQDEVVQPRKMYIDTIDSAKALDGKTTGSSPATHSTTIPTRAPSRVRPPVRSLAERAAASDSGHRHRKSSRQRRHSRAQGDKQAFAVFKMPNDTKDYATAIGYMQGTDATFYCDQVFYYDDPHQMYNYWGPQVWAAMTNTIPFPA